MKDNFVWRILCIANKEARPKNILIVSIAIAAPPIPLVKSCPYVEDLEEKENGKNYERAEFFGFNSHIVGRIAGILELFLHIADDRQSDN